MEKYEKHIHTNYIDNITGNYPNVDFCMFKAVCIGVNEITYTCERIYKNNKNGLYFSRNDWNSNSPPRENGFDIEAEDPRIFILNEQVYVIFICLSPYENQYRCIGITAFDKWEPIFLQIENVSKNDLEKNWAPFVKDNKLYFVYNYDPLIILHYDLNSEGICKIVFTQNNYTLPLNTSNTYLRGGSNLIHYKDQYYIGGCHSRIYKECFEHYTHIIILDTNNWELVYVSKPILYNYHLSDDLNCWGLRNKKKLDTYNNILIDKSPNLIQDPISMYIYNNKYYMTINIRDCVTLLYTFSLDDSILNNINRNKDIGYYDNYIKETILFM
jgi:hypothetical protein